MSNWGAGPQDAGTVQIRVQVVDVDPAGLDMIVPTYIAAKDLSQRIARDANLGAYWPDGTRRDFWIRARGRIMGAEEKLEDLGVVNQELLHLLPHPPANSGVIEQPPQLPPVETDRVMSILRIARAALALLAFMCVWALAMSLGPVWYVSLIPAFALGLISTTLGRHILGPPGNSIRVPLVGVGIFILVLIFGFLPGFLAADDMVYAVLMFLLSFFAGLTGVFVSWLAWYGAVEALPRERIEQMVQQIQEVREAPCGICGQPVDLADPVIRLDRACCGQVFHSGCYKARAAVTREGTCAFCGYNPDAAAG